MGWPEIPVGALFALLIGAVGADGQLRYRTTDNGPWRPWHFTAIASARQSRGATAAEVEAWQRRLQELGAIVRRAPAVAQPVGFAAEMWGNLDGYGTPVKGEPAGAKIPLAGSLTFGAFPLIEFMRNGKLVNEDMKGGETELLEFTINQISRGMFSQTMPSEWSGEEAVGFVEPKRLGGFPGGLERIDDVLVLVAGRNAARPLWVPLKLDEALAPVLKQRRGIFENRRDNLAKQRSEFAEWVTPAKREERRAGWRQAAAAMSADQGKAFLANMEKSDVEIEKSRRVLLAPGGREERDAEEGERDLREAESILSAQRGALNQPACYDKTAKGLAGRFRVLQGAPPSCEPLVRTNWTFFDPARPRTAPQLLMVSHFGRCLTRESIARGEAPRGGCAINRKLIDTMDWAAVKAWMDQN